MSDEEKVGGEPQSSQQVQERGEPAPADSEPSPAASKPVQFRVKIGSLGNPDIASEAKPRPASLYPSRLSIEEAEGSGQQAESRGQQAEGGPRRDKQSEVDEVGEPIRSAPPKSAAVVDDVPRTTVPKPGRQLAAELEQEIEDALGGMSLDTMLAGSVPAAAAEDLEPETRVSGRVVSVHQEDVFVDLGNQNQGVVSLKQLSEPPQPGQMLELVVARFNADEGLYELTPPGAAVDVADWTEVDEGMVVQAVVTGHNKGGLEVTVNNIRGFIPVSQVALYRVEDMQPFVGQSFPCVVTEANRERRNLVLSRRAVLEREQAEAKQQMLDSITVGETREGVVRSLQNFGAFVDLGGTDGLIHVSQLSWDRVGHPSEVLHVGQKVRVKIEKFDRATGKIGLSYRDLAENPWGKAAAKYPVGSRVIGTVTKLMDFGAFVKLEPGVEGLVHISELSYRRVFRASDAVSEGQEVEVQVLSVDTDAQRISLSMKALEEKPTPVDLEKKKEEEALAEIEASSKSPKKRQGPLKGGLGGPTGGAKFGLKW